jgi:phosphatidylserine/phosphatidylglycerophosphate/cardiolipin synthase-like enzyme
MEDLGTTGGAISVWTLTDGEQTAADVAPLVAAFLASAQRSLDIALYDLNLSPAVAEPVLGALHDAVHRGVAVRLAYNLDHAKAIPVPPPPQTPPEMIERCGVPTKAIPGVPDLMHHKYVVRDAAAVWTGSANWTDDSWNREENVLVTVGSPEVAAAFARDFEELWTSGAVQPTGAFDTDPVALAGATVRPWFSPGRGRKLAHRIAAAIGRAERRIRICSPVITAGAILGTLADLAANTRSTRGPDLAGVVDATQMRQVLRQWRRDQHAAWKEPAFRSLVARAPFSGKVTTPYAPGTVHDYMHAKFTVADDTVFVGSYNLSGSGQDNAENVLEIEDAGLAGRLAAFADRLRARYPSAAGL